jgi:hypothetical protein
MQEGDMNEMKQSSSKKPTSGSKQQAGKLPVVVATRDDKTTVRQFAGRRFVRLGEVRGKKVAWVELYTAGPDRHSVTVRFQDQTGLHLEIKPGFTLKPEYFSQRTGEYRLLKEWPEMKSER